ncbi:MAG: hypothetical protein M0R46_16585 [Candidatus Muirbacterium halophilum]|nr:hypothetical protein [Candidatus Muirbacterium halophilum]MCK9477535.1 hypothetical protein [Candidatus Muirbacterium halophilum]
MKKLILLLICLSFFTQIYSENLNSDLQDNVFSIVNTYWESQDLLYNIKENNRESETLYNEKLVQLNIELDNLAKNINQKGNLKEFSDIYKTLPEETRYIFTPVISELNIKRADGELFPGYGYSEPGFYYRKGEELRKETLQKFWKSEERYFEKNHRYKFYVELKVSQSMEQSAQAGGNLEGFDVKGVFGMKINGEFKQVAEVEFTTKETLTTKCVVAYEKNKVFYNLYRAKKGYFDWLPWIELNWSSCGETYVVVEEATGTSVIVNMPSVPGVPSNAILNSN